MTHINQDLKTLIQSFKPQRLLAVGPAAEEYFKTYLQDCNHCELVSVSAGDALKHMQESPRFDLGLVSHTLEAMPKDDAKQLVSRLRDIHCIRLILIVAIGPDWPNHVSHWKQQDLIELGFVRIGEYSNQTGPVHVYAFDIASYKSTPDWLNDRYWAHPELFNKYWW